MRGARRVPACLAAAAGLVCSVLALAIAQSRDQSPRSVDFNREIRPILSDNCFACHGPDEKQRQVDLRLDVKEGALGRPGLIVPGDPASSRLFQRISAANPRMRMPPHDSGRNLSDRQIALLRRWIQEGARWEIHWAYLPAEAAGSALDVRQLLASKSDRQFHTCPARTRGAEAVT